MLNSTNYLYLNYIFTHYLVPFFMILWGAMGINFYNDYLLRINFRLTPKSCVVVG